MKRSPWFVAAWLMTILLLSACRTATPPASSEVSQRASLQPTATTPPPPATSTSTKAPATIARATATGTTSPTATAAPSPTAAPTTVAPPAPTTDYGLAPEIDTEVWLNTDAPLRLAHLRGQVTIVEFWTYG